MIISGANNVFDPNLDYNKQGAQKPASGDEHFIKGSEIIEQQGAV